MKKLRNKYQYGTWYYMYIKPDLYNDLDGPIYELYNFKNEYIATFACYSDMKSAVEYGNIQEWVRIYG